MRKEVEIQHVKERIAYAEAAKRVGGGKQVRDEGERKQKRGYMLHEVERKLWKEKKKMVTFIAGVINATAEIKSKMERIQIIVKAASHHLDMRDLRWEEIRDELSLQMRQEPQWVG